MENLLTLKKLKFGDENSIRYKKDYEWRNLLKKRKEKAKTADIFDTEILEAQYALYCPECKKMQYIHTDDIIDLNFAECHYCSKLFKINF